MTKYIQPPRSEECEWRSGPPPEIERLRADAARYRWMRDRKACPFAETDPAWDDLDAAIDAQMRGESEA